MQESRILELNKEAKLEMLNTKLTMIDDYFRAKKYLVNLGQYQHKDYYDRAGDIFDRLYDSEPEDILLEVSYLYGEISMYYKRITGFDDIQFLGC